MLEELISYQYNNFDNYKVVDISAAKRCIIFCSSNELWDYSEESFRREIIERDKYEWENVSKHKRLRSVYGKMIFIRDIKMHFYVEGINSRINSVDEIISLLKNITLGYDITLAGDSAGGYLAILLGCALNAKRVFSFGGQFDLKTWSGGNNKLSFSDFTDIYKHKDEKKYNKWFDLYNILSISDVKFFHFYAGKCESDIKQIEPVSALNNIFSFAINSEKHGKYLRGYCYPYIFIASDKKLIRYSRNNANKMINQRQISLKFVGVIPTIIQLAKGIRRKFLKK